MMQRRSFLATLAAPLVLPFAGKSAPVRTVADIGWGCSITFGTMPFVANVKWVESASIDLPPVPIKFTKKTGTA